MKIKIVIWSPQKNYSIYADEETGDFTFGLETKKEGVQTFVRQAIQIVKEWPDVLEDKDKIDGICYKIAYEDAEETRQLVGSNKTPETFPTLMYLIEKNRPNNKDFLAREEIRKREILNTMISLDMK